MALNAHTVTMQMLYIYDLHMSTYIYIYATTCRLQYHRYDLIGGIAMITMEYVNVRPLFSIKMSQKKFNNKFKWYDLARNWSGGGVYWANPC